MSARLVKSDLGAQSVGIYPCPVCRADLRSPLTYAGKTDTCPNCGAAYIVPGAEQLKQLQEVQAAERRLPQDNAAAKSGGAGDYSGSKYPFLATLTSLYRIVAILAFCVGIIAIVVSIPEQNASTFGFGVGAVGAGISAMLGAEVINLFLDMEKNQRESNRLLEQIVNRLAANGEPPAKKP